MTTPREFAIQVTEQLQAAGYQALWAGGCVRDQLLNKQPKDYDVATIATPDQIRELFGHRKTLALGAAFGVITLIGPKSAGNIEIATFRKDSDYSDGRRPDAVEFSTAEMDAMRRDFTINGLFFDPLKQEILDYVGGQADLELKLIRAIGNPAERIAEDKLRMLRSVRFAANLDFQIDPATTDTIVRHANEINVVSVERISAELTRMLTHENRRRAVELLHETGLLTNILPELSPMVQDAERFERTLQNLQRLNSIESPPSFAVTMVTLLESPAPEDFFNLCKRLKQPNEVTNTGHWILVNIDTIRQSHDLAWSAVQPLLVKPFAEQAIEFLQAVDPNCAAIPFCRERLAWPADKLDPAELLNGDILRKHGFNPGPQYKKILQETRRAQLDGQIATTEQAMQIAQSIVDQASG